MKRNTVADFHAWYEKLGPEDCWLWTGKLNAKGYGRFWLDGKQHKAHNLALALVSERDPERPQACHSCDVPSCVNPNHLRWGTNDDNVRDMVSRGRNRAPLGEANKRSKLTEDRVHDIRRLDSLGRHSQGELARLFEVDRKMIYLIVNRKAWKHI